MHFSSSANLAVALHASPNGMKKIFNLSLEHQSFVSVGIIENNVWYMDRNKTNKKIMPCSTLMK